MARSLRVRGTEWRWLVAAILAVLAAVRTIAALVVAVTAVVLGPSPGGRSRGLC